MAFLKEKEKTVARCIFAVEMVLFCTFCWSDFDRDVLEESSSDNMYRKSLKLR
jgi:hypothetical protein